MELKIPKEFKFGSLANRMHAYFSSRTYKNESPKEQNKEKMEIEQRAYLDLNAEKFQKEKPYTNNQT